MIEFFIPIEPEAASRPRFACINGHAKAYPLPAYKLYQAELATFFSTLTLSEPIEVYDGPIELDLCFIMPRPKGKSIIERGWMKPDIDNLAKPIMDAMTKAEYFFKDDAQITRLRVEKLFAREEVALGTNVQLTYW